MKIYFSVLFVSIFSLPLLAQKMEGVITYDHTYHWSRIYQRMEFLSQEEKDRVKLTRGYDEGYTTKMKLVFNQDQSLFTYLSDQGESADGRWTWKQSDYVITRDFAANRQSDWIQMLGRTYQIEDSLRTPQWKIMNKIKDVSGYLCMMAVTEDTLKKQKITAWFADALPVPVGPGVYFGLPGAILELDINDGDVVLTATNISLQPVGDQLKPAKKLKGRKIDNKQHDTLVYKHIQDSIKSRRNPFWALPY